MPSHLRTASTKTCARTRSAQAFGDHLATKLQKTFSGELQHFLGHVSHMLLWSSFLKFLVVEPSTLGLQPNLSSLRSLEPPLPKARSCWLLRRSTASTCLVRMRRTLLAISSRCNCIVGNKPNFPNSPFTNNVTLRSALCCRGRPRCRHPFSEVPVGQDHTVSKLLAASTWTPAAHLAQTPSSRPPRPPVTRTFHRLSSGWLCNAASARDCDAVCGLCGEVLDRWGDYALCCGGGGDRVLCHNAIPNTVCSAVAEFTSISPELEKPRWHLRWPRPRSCFPRGGRRPADIWVPRASGLADAWDFSVSSLLRPSLLSSATPSVAGEFHEVETRKNSFQNTASQVAALGATFRPVVLEACGGRWSPAPRGYLSTESRAMRGLAGDTPRDVSLRIAQRISCTLHRENARATSGGPPKLSSAPLV